MKYCDNSTRNDWVYSLASTVIVVLVFILSSYSVTEGDLFWHLKNGEWIFQHKAIPGFDPFAYTTSLFPEPENAVRQYTVLSAYWLGQIMLYGVWALGGYAGIVIMRATVYALLISCLAFWVGRYSRGVLAISSILAAGASMIPFSNERPQIFGYILFVLLMAALETARNTKENIRPVLWCMSLILMIWANIHGSFLLGDALLVVYGITHLVLARLRGTDRSWSYLALIGTSLLASLVNPNSFTLLKEFFRHYKTGIAGGVSEYISPIVMVWKYQIVSPYWILVFVVAGILATRFRSMAWEHRLTLLLMLGISLNNLRYVPFFICVIPLAFIYLPARLDNRWKIIAVSMVLVVWAGTRTYLYSFTFMPHRQFPVEAVRFINESKPQGLLFNHIDWGGYAMFFSGRQVFCDGRYMVNSARKIHDLILLSPSGLELLDGYGISVVLIPGTVTFPNSREYGKPWPLIEQLKRDGRWALVHSDDTALVFLRKFKGNDPLIMSNELPKSKIEEHIRNRMQWQRIK